MKNKSAIITGSTSGIGLSLAQHLAKGGCHIMLSGFGDRHEIEITGTAISIDGGWTAQ